MGVSGEEMTATELQLLARRGWRTVNGLMIREKADIDHVAVGPSGVLVIETKRSAERWPVGVSGKRFMVEALERAVHQAADSTRDVSNQFKREIAGAPLHAVVVVWSAAPKMDRESPWADHGGVTVVRGGHLKRGWRAWTATASTQRAWTACGRRSRGRRRCGMTASHRHGRPSNNSRGGSFRSVSARSAPAMRS